VNSSKYPEETLKRREIMTKTYVLIVVILGLVVSSSNAFAQISFAILPMEAKGNVSAEDREEAESYLYQYLIESRKYKIIERGRIEEIMKEQSFQMTGATDRVKAVEIGKVLGVEKLIASTIYLKIQNQFAMKVSVIDVTTAEVEFSKEISLYNYRPSDLAKFCTSYIVAEYPLLGEILGKAKDIIVVNLGRNHGLKTGDRLFVARKEVLVDDNGEVLFQGVNRIGILRVTKLDAVRSQTEILSLEDPNNAFEKHDLVSPEPIPKKEPLISPEPLLPDVVKGKLLLDDDMEQRKYLSPANNAGEAYIGGKLHLNATQLTVGHVYCYYPIPFDNLENFVIEGVVEFQPIKEKYNKFSVVFRKNGPYQSSNCYNFYWHNQGEFAVYQWRLANPFEIVPLQSSPAINRGESQNTFRVVAYGSKFDCYLNDQFVTGFEDETLEKGSIGFMVETYGYATVDNVKIWEAVKKSNE
jgi:hypothetical protein